MNGFSALGKDSVYYEWIQCISNGPSELGIDPLN